MAPVSPNGVPLHALADNAAYSMYHPWAGFCKTDRPGWGKMDRDGGPPGKNGISDETIGKLQGHMLEVRNIAKEIMIDLQNLKQDDPIDD